MPETTPTSLSHDLIVATKLMPSMSSVRISSEFDEKVLNEVSVIESRFVIAYQRHCHPLLVWASDEDDDYVAIFRIHIITGQDSASAVSSPVIDGEGGSYDDVNALSSTVSC